MRSTVIHDILSKGRFSWIYLIIFIIKLTFYSSAYAQPQGKQMPDRDTRAWKPFLVDLKINQQDSGSAFVWQHENGKDWLLPVDLLQRSRVRIPLTVPLVIRESINYVSTASLIRRRQTSRRMSNFFNANWRSPANSPRYATPCL